MTVFEHDSQEFVELFKEETELLQKYTKIFDNFSKEILEHENCRCKTILFIKREFLRKTILERKKTLKDSMDRYMDIIRLELNGTPEELALQVKL